MKQKNKKWEAEESVPMEELISREESTMEYNQRLIDYMKETFTDRPEKLLEFASIVEHNIEDILSVRYPQQKKSKKKDLASKIGVTVRRLHALISGDATIRAALANQLLVVLKSYGKYRYNRAPAYLPEDLRILRLGEDTILLYQWIPDHSDKIVPNPGEFPGDKIKALQLKLARKEAEPVPAILLYGLMKVPPANLVEFQQLMWSEDSVGTDIGHDTTVLPWTGSGVSFLSEIQGVELPWSFFFLSTCTIEKPEEAVENSNSLVHWLRTTSLEETFGTNVEEELKKNHLLYTPTENSYNTVFQYIKYLVTSDDIAQLFLSLYRVSLEEDNAMLYLINLALHQGKRVTILLELNARGSEQANLSLLSEQLMRLKSIYQERLHLYVGYGSFKLHAKMCIGVTHDGRTYTHLSSGNYHQKTVKRYKDFQYLTADPKVGKQAIEMLLSLCYAKTAPVSSEGPMHFSPTELKPFLLGILERMTTNARTYIGKKTGFSIDIKCNNLTDPEICQALLEAANAGIPVRLLCRTSCSLRPRSELGIRSLVGEYLEHGRVYIFHEPDTARFARTCLIGSSDLMTRNLEKRVEAMVEITEEDMMDRLEGIFNQEYDSPDAFGMTETGEWKRIQ